MPFCLRILRVEAMIMADLHDKVNGSWLVALITLLDACELYILRRTSAQPTYTNEFTKVNSCWFGYDQVSRSSDGGLPILDGLTDIATPRAFLLEFLSPRTS